MSKIIALERIAECKVNKSTELHLIGLGLTQIPIEIQELTWLESLNLELNKIQNISTLSNLVNLQILDLSGNQIQDINSLANLINLDSLYLFNNLITDISPLINLVNLSRLGLPSNRISNADLSLGFKNLREIVFLNSFIKLDSGIKELAKRPHLTFELYNSSIESVPQSLLENNDFGAVMISSKVLNKWFTSELVLESKMVFLGNTKVGKTAFFHKLLDYPKETEIYKGDATHDINMGSWTFQYTCKKDEKLPTNSDGNFKVNVFDFGGDMLLQPVHKYFLSGGSSVYVLLIEARQADNDRNIYYKWLPMIRFYGKDSPIIVIFNTHNDSNYNCDVPQDVRKEFKIAEVLHMNIGKKNLKDSNLTQVINALKKYNIQVRKREHPSWQLLQEKMNEAIAQKKHLVPIEDFSGWCEELKLGETGKFWASFLHDLGYCFYFDLAQYPELKNWVCIDKQWLTQAVYSVLWSADFRSKKPFTWDMLIDFIKNQKVEKLRNSTKLYKYKEYEYQHILGCMKAFRIIHEVADTENRLVEYITPLLLEKEPPKGYRPLWKIHTKANVARAKVVFTKFAPYGLLFALMANKYKEINTQWEKGVLFENKTENVWVEVVEIERTRIEEMIFSVYCENTVIQMQHFTKFYNELQATFREAEISSKVEYDLEIACNCKKCKISKEPNYFKYAALHKLLTNFGRKEMIACTKWDISEKISVATLLHGYKISPMEERLTFLEQQMQLFQETQNETLEISKDTNKGVKRIENKLNGFLVKFDKLKSKKITDLEQRIIELQELFDAQSIDNYEVCKNEIQAEFLNLANFQHSHSLEFLAVGHSLHKRFLQQKNLPDFSAAILQYCRAVEGEVKEIFEAFAQSLSLPINGNTKFCDFIRNLKNSVPIAGTNYYSYSNQVSQLEKAIANNPVGALLPEFQNFLQATYASDFSKFTTFVNDLVSLKTDDYRNKAAHPATLMAADADDCKNKVIALLNNLLDAK